MRRNCERCGDGFPAKTTKARFCSDSCREMAYRTRKKAQADPGRSVASSLTVDQVRVELERAGRVETYLGSAALQLAARIDQSTAVMGFAALVKELRATMDAALAGVKVAADPVDELRARRDSKRAG